MININRCKKCGSYNIKVADSREHGCEIWRTRVCQDCGGRIHTMEICRDDLPDIERSNKALQMIKEGMEILNEMAQ